MADQATALQDLYEGLTYAYKETGNSDEAARHAAIYAMSQHAPTVALAREVVALAEGASNG